MDYGRCYCRRSRNIPSVRAEPMAVLSREKIRHTRQPDCPWQAEACAPGGNHWTTMFGGIQGRQPLAGVAGSSREQQSPQARLRERAGTRLAEFAKLGVAKHPGAAGVATTRSLRSSEVRKHPSRTAASRVGAQVAATTSWPQSPRVRCARISATSHDQPVADHAYVRPRRSDRSSSHPDTDYRSGADHRSTPPWCPGQRD